MLSLAALANWEMSVLASIAGATGTLEERDAQITRSGMYAEYPAIFAGYLELATGVDDPAVSLEAIKRCVFLAWIATHVPPPVSGIAELPDSAVRQLMDALGDAITGGAADDELRLMLAWYDSRFDYPFDHFGPVRGLRPLIEGVTAVELAPLVARPDRFSGRGQLGRYWSSLQLPQP